MKPKLRILYLEDDDLLRRIIGNWLREWPDFETEVHTFRGVDEAESLSEAVDQLDLAILDAHIHNSTMDGIDLCGQIRERHADCRIVIMTQHRKFYEEALQFHTSYVLKSDGCRVGEDGAYHLFTILKGVIAGESYASPALNRDGPSALRRQREERLTPKQRELLSMISRGCSNEEIANAHEISIRTVEKHINNINAKIGDQSVPPGPARRARLVRIATDLMRGTD
ncbi:MAG: response regulator transcription factor [Leptospiraceae bacterium]|nr:response regulator transcription factor [Leptospiraceae bacterium]MCP5485911.1 response regulator transcription factor [Spirochaetales bacterium]